MKLYLQELTDQDTDLDFTQEEPWVREAVTRVDEKPAGPETPTTRARAKERPIHVHFNLRKVDGVVVVTGGVETRIELICSRCATPFSMETHPSFNSLYTQDPVMAGVAYLADKGGKGKRPAGHIQGHARHAHDENSKDDGDLDITYLAEDTIDLGQVLTEQLTLQVPFQPLCRENCKGICPHCGADWNVGRCACDKLTKTKPFAALKNLNIPTTKTTPKIK